MKKTNGHNWKDFEVDTLIVIFLKMDAEFFRSAKKKVCLWFFFDFAKIIQLQLRPLWPLKGLGLAWSSPSHHVHALGESNLNPLGKKKKPAPSTYVITSSKIGLKKKLFLLQNFLIYTNFLFVGNYSFFNFQVPSHFLLRNHN
jgi:hypothetical protein